MNEIQNKIKRTMVGVLKMPRDLYKRAEKNHSKSTQ